MQLRQSLKLNPKYIIDIKEIDFVSADYLKLK